MVAGSLTYDTKMDTSGFQKGLDKINSSTSNSGTKLKTMLAALGIDKIVTKAFSAINDSMDDAIKRLDILNNFPNVMSNLNISAKDSQKVINRLSEELVGLPTTLDAAALSVQRFTSKNGDIEKSADMFLALNNAILAGGASTQIQESALEQLTQSYTKGKMDMMEWRTIQMAMPAQLKQVADTMGLTTNELGEMMREGDNTKEVLDQFIDTIIDLNKNGGKNIKSFEEQAKNATKGIQTNIKNMKVAIARGVANIIDSLDKALKKANLGGVGEVIKNIGVEAEKALKKIGTAIGKIDFAKIIKTLKTLWPVIEGVVAAFIAYHGALLLVNAVSVISGILGTATAFIQLIPSIHSAKDAMLLLNATFKANPFGIVAGAAVGLITTFGLLKKHTDENVEAHKKEMEEIKKETDSIKEQTDSWNDLKEAQQSKVNVSMTELSHEAALYEELKNITDENGKVKKGYEDRASFITSELSDSLGVEIKMTDGVIQNYKDLQTEIDNVIRKKKAQIILDAQEELYAEAIKKRTEAQKKLEELQDKVNEKKSKRNQLEGEYEALQRKAAEAYIHGNEAEAARLEYLALKKKQALNMADEEYKKVESNYKKQEDLINQYYYNIGQYEKNAELFHKGEYEKMSTVNWDYAKDFQAAGDSEKATLQAQIEDEKKSLEYLKYLKEKSGSDLYDQQIKDGEAQIKLWEDQLKQYEITTEEGLDNVNEDWKSGLGKQLTTIMNRKVQFKDAGNGLVQMYVDGVKVGEPMAEDEMRKMAQKSIDEVNNKKTDAKTAGENLIDGVKSGVSNRNKQSGVFGALSNFANNALATLKASLKEHSPSKATEEMGINLLKGLDVGVDKEKIKTLNMIDNLGDDILDKMSNAVNIETGEMSFSGTSGSVSQILNANSSFEGNINVVTELDGETVYENQQKVELRKRLQYGK